MIRSRWFRIFSVTGFVAVVVLIAILGLWEKVTTVSSQVSFSVEYDTDRGGGDYKNFDMSEANHEVCRNYCAADSTCKAYTYTKPGGGASAHCWLKNSVPTPVPYRS